MTFPIDSVAEFYAHALALECEAAERYREFAAHMRDHDKDELADLFGRLGRLEQDHARFLERKAAGLALPDVPPGEYRWIDRMSPEATAHEWVLRITTPYDVLNIALAAEKRARAYFEHVAETATDEAVRVMALEMAAEEGDHAGRLERMLAHEPNPVVDWEREFAAKG